jgi:endoglucanase
MGSVRRYARGGQRQVRVASNHALAVGCSKVGSRASRPKIQSSFSYLSVLTCVFIACRAILGQNVTPAADGDGPTSDRHTAHIAFNTVGYLPQANKCATILGGGSELVVRDASSNREVLRVKLRQFGESSAPSRNMLADFSELRREGNYRLAVPGLGESSEFRVGPDLFNWPFYCAVRAMYLCRCGCPVHSEFAGHTFRHDACHTDDAYLDYVESVTGERKDFTGGWHDAGDYNKYTVNGAFTAAMMLQAWEDFYERLKPLDFDIPESTNTVPDYLDEVRWELNWLLKMQAADGRVYHKISALNFCGFILPDRETAKRYVSPWGSAATAEFAAIMAQAARVYRPFDSAYADRCLSAARKSYDFLLAHPEDHHPDLSAFSTGAYVFGDVGDRLWMAGELWETTGEAMYLQDLEGRIKSYREKKKKGATLIDGNWDWNSVRNLGLFTYLLSKRPGRDARLIDELGRDAVRVADDITEATMRDAYGRTLGSAYFWGCNGTELRLAINLHVAQALTGDKKYEAAILDGINHVFGRNIHGRSYVTGLGYRPPLFPHDRRSGGLGGSAPWPGYVIGGAWPNAADWRDDRDDYKTNEIAINWNGALIYALAGFVEPQDFDASVRAAKSSAATTSKDAER